MLQASQVSVLRASLVRVGVLRASQVRVGVLRASLVRVGVLRSPLVRVTPVGVLRAASLVDVPVLRASLFGVLRASLVRVGVLLASLVRVGVTSRWLRRLSESESVFCGLR